MSSNENVKPWHAAFPAPVSTPIFMTQAETLQLLHHHHPGKDFVLVDVRRTDFEGGTIVGSLNLPAHSLFTTRAAVYNLLRNAGTELAVFYCVSSNGRGPRAAAWMQDYINAQGDTKMKCAVLQGGIKGWAKAGEEYVKFMEGYDEGVWGEGEEARR